METTSTTTTQAPTFTPLSKVPATHQRWQAARNPHRLAARMAAAGITAYPVELRDDGGDSDYDDELWEVSTVAPGTYVRMVPADADAWDQARVEQGAVRGGDRRGRSEDQLWADVATRARKLRDASAAGAEVGV